MDLVYITYCVQVLDLLFPCGWVTWVVSMYSVSVGHTKNQVTRSAMKAGALTKAHHGKGTDCICR